MRFSRRWGSVAHDRRPAKSAIMAGVASIVAVVVVALLPHIAGDGAALTASSLGSPGSAGSPSGAAGSDQGSRTVRPLVVPVTTTTVPTTVPTTVATTVPTTVATPVPAKAPAPAPKPVPASPPPTANAGAMLPPAHPAADIPPSPNFLNSCSGSSYDDSTGCVSASLAAINNARADEGLASMTLPSNWTSLTAQQQMFVVTNLERTVRGLAPMSAMATSLDQSSESAAAADNDPSPAAGFPYNEWGGNWSGAMGNPLEAMYMWMYDDGVGSANIDCTATDTSGCWGHRDNVLLVMSCAPCVMGAGFSATAYRNTPSMTELLVSTSGSPALDFTWQEEEPYL